MDCSWKDVTELKQKRLERMRKKHEAGAQPKGWHHTGQENAG
jgi:hypothetical protein